MCNSLYTLSKFDYKKPNLVCMIGGEMSQQIKKPLTNKLEFLAYINENQEFKEKLLSGDEQTLKSYFELSGQKVTIHERQLIED